MDISIVNYQKHSADGVSPEEFLSDHISKLCVLAQRLCHLVPKSDRKVPMDLPVTTKGEAGDLLGEMLLHMALLSDRFGFGLAWYGLMALKKHDANGNFMDYALRDLIYPQTHELVEFFHEEIKQEIAADD